MKQLNSFREFLNESSDITIDADLNDPDAWDKSLEKEYVKKYKIKFGNFRLEKYGVGFIPITGSKKNIIKFLNAPEPYGLSIDEIEEFYPQLYK